MNKRIGVSIKDQFSYSSCYKRLLLLHTQNSIKNEFKGTGDLVYHALKHNVGNSNLVREFTSLTRFSFIKVVSFVVSVENSSSVFCEGDVFVLDLTENNNSESASLNKTNQ